MPFISVLSRILLKDTARSLPARAGNRKTSHSEGEIRGAEVLKALPPTSNLESEFPNHRPALLDAPRP
jgi:hypothetical protein